jgi:Fe-S-cluster-containing dehydrogenase component
MRVKAYLKKCIGCQMCMVACAVVQTGSFNPRDSKVLVPVEISRKPIAIKFPHHCNTDLTDQCSFDNTPPCVAACPTQALEFIMALDGVEEEPVNA